MRWLILLTFLMLLLPLSSAGSISNGSTINSTVMNLSITFERLTPMYMHQIDVLDNAINIYNASYTHNNYHINITFINETSGNKTIDLYEFPYVSASTNDYIRIKSNLTNNVNGTISNISVYQCARITSVSYKSASESYSRNYLLSEVSCMGNVINLLDLDEIENTNSTSYNQISIGYYTGASGGGGSSYTYLGFTGDSNTTYLCMKTFGYINKYNRLDFTKLDELIGEIEQERGYVESKTKLQDYIMNWQLFCSDRVNRTLNEIEVCSELYYFLIENDNNYTTEELFELKEDLNNQGYKISLTLLNLYASNYKSMCEDITDLKLPSKFPNLKEIIAFQDIPKCNPYLNNTILDAYIPFFKFTMDGMSCNKVDFWRWIFKLEEVSDGSFKVIGLKFNIFLGALLFIAFLYVIRLTSTLTRYLSNIQKRNKKSDDDS